MIKELSYDNVIPQIVEAMLPRGSKTVLTIKVKINSYHYFDESDYDCFNSKKFVENNPDINVDELYEFESIKLIEFIFSRRSNYTLVLARIFNPYEDKETNEFIFKVQSYHDSAWRIDGLQIIRTTVSETIKNVENLCKKYLSHVPEIYTSGNLEDIRLHNVKEEHIDAGIRNDYRIKGCVDLNCDLSIIPV